METLPLDTVVDALAAPHLARAALWRLVAAGADALEAVKRGLRSPDPGVRRGCCEVLDLFGDEEAAKAMLPLLEDSHPDVRWMAGHALTCDRCKTDNTWIKRQQKLPR